ncbi:hypothetical protein J1605_009775 [Eschrichtius robustus]|uniref:Uncharacterized protein n=1 Tax=Eschrichtius robustus TaxID=9764 RepID=A0AB34GRM7_ESCRO|nr:hypothetical protein J1605_009775 [Eschrichtius robustus]
MSWYEAQVEKSPQQIPSRDEGTSPDCKTKGSWKKPVTNRKLSADKDEVMVNDEIGEVHKENLKRCAEIKKTVKGRKLKDLSSFSNVKTAYLLKKSAALTIVLPEDSEDSELEVEDVMHEVECLLEELKRQDGYESTGVSLRRKHTMLKPEELESRRASHKSLKCYLIDNMNPTPAPQTLRSMRAETAVVFTHQCIPNGHCLAYTDHSKRVCSMTLDNHGHIH